MEVKTLKIGVRQAKKKHPQAKPAGASMINYQWSPYRDEVEREPSRLPSLRQVIIHEPHRLVKVSPEQERISPVEATLKE